MFEKVAKENFYSQNGTLLLSKGSIITYEIQNKLSKLNTLEPPEKHLLHDIPKNVSSVETQRVFDTCTDRMKQKDLNIDPELFNRSSQILKEIIFDAK